MFSEAEKRALNPFFTNIDRNVFCLVNLPEVVKGALFSRYSRSPKSLRKILLDEFMVNRDLGFESRESTVNEKKAEEFYDRVLLGYGDDSVAELGGAHIALEGVSNMATKAIEDARIGLSFLEKSTRYVRFDDKRNGEYLFLREPDIMSSRHADLYLNTCNSLFDTYSKLMGPLIKYIEEKNPQGEESERAYDSTIRAKACDVLRGLLPASTLTNMGVFGNGRAFESLITKMLASDLSEVRSLGKSMEQELGKVIPSFVKRADNDQGKELQSYLRDTRHSMERLAFNLPEVSANSVTLIDSEGEDKAIAAMLYPYSSSSFDSILETVKMMSKVEKEKIALEYMGRRNNRRHKPGRALENVYYTFDILANYGAYRDLQRHRMLTQERQLLTTKHGYDTPKELIESGFDSEFRESMEASKSAFEEIKGMEKQAQYLVPMAFRMRWYITLNLRQLYFLCELRSSRQGHVDYRRIAQQLASIAREKSPLLASYMKFVDMDDYSLERLEAEKRLDRKIQERKSSSVL